MCNTKIEVIRNYINNQIREDLLNEANNIIDSCGNMDLNRLINCIKRDNKSKPAGQTFYMELDFTKSRLVYFGKMKADGEFGISFDLIPDMVERWREEKLNSL